MARRRMSNYGTAPMPPMQPGNFPLPPPPDGKPPVRLPVGVSQQEQGQQQMMPPQGEEQEPDGELAMLIRMIQQQGQR